MCFAIPLDDLRVLRPTPQQNPELFVRVLHQFDAEHPVGEVLLHEVGSYLSEVNVYGVTTPSGDQRDGATGRLRGGTIYELAPNPSRPYAWTHWALYQFCAQGGDACTDGESPSGGLVEDASGTLFGTTIGGGVNARPEHFGKMSRGTAFKLTPNQDRTAWTFTVLYSFCSQGGDACTDGMAPMGSLIQDGSGNLYGTTYGGGQGGGGTVFKLALDKATGRWIHTILHSFCMASACTDGTGPKTALTLDSGGNLYGTTRGGGSAGGGGTVFRLVPDADGKAWSHHALLSFCSACGSGSAPESPVVLGDDGKLYGSTVGGGIDFKLERWGPERCEGCLVRFYNEFGEPYINLFALEAYDDAAQRLTSATFSPEGLFWGGTLFSLTPNSDGSVWTHTVIYRFCSQIYCIDGKNPIGKITTRTQGQQTVVIGSTSAGGGFAVRDPAYRGANGLVNRGVFFSADTASYRSIYTRCRYASPDASHCPEGGASRSGLTFEADDVYSNAYGTAVSAGRADRSAAAEIVYVLCRDGGLVTCVEGADVP